jgi:uncharacterized protein (TIGR02597 family)
VITVAGTPGWTASQFVYASGTQSNTYAVLIATGTKEGLYLKVTANDATTLTVQPMSASSADDLSGVATIAANSGAGDSISIVPYWTPGTLLSGTIPDNTEMFVYDNTASGQNLAPSVPLVYFNGFGWFESLGFTAQNDRPILFGTGFIVRNHSASPITVTVTGAVPMTTNRVVLRTLAANTPQDQRITYSSPVPEILGNLNLGAQDNDQLFIFDNSTTGFNKAPTPLVYFGGSWYNSLTFTDVTNTTTIQPGTSFIYRAGATANPTNFVWAHLPNYLQ